MARVTTSGGGVAGYSTITYYLTGCANGVCFLVPVRTTKPYRNYRVGSVGSTYHMQSTYLDTCEFEHVN